MIQGRTNLIDFIRVNNTPHWYLRRSEKSDPVFTSGDEKEITLDESISRLNKCLDMLATGSYFIEAWETPGQKVMRKKDSFTLSGQGDGGQYPISGTFPVPAEDSGAKIAAAVAEAVEKLKTEQKIETMADRIKELELENKELKKEADSWQGRVFSNIAPYVGTILQAFGIDQGAGVSGTVAGQKENLFSDQEAQRLNKAFEQWSANENQYVDIVEKIAEMSANDNATYSMARGMLLSK
ncbi:MAG: hypothetical protein KAZ36_01800 [Bacteroidales bacterium]|nr:hypothetical protein [Bacteroidales bacterium]